ncbi:MAG: DUF447 domain-containing protein [Candidatus Hydrothermarchaeota archaeon]
MKRKLEKIGIVEDRICEVIVSTFNADRSLNTAPMGCFLKEGMIVLRVHEGSHTFQNLMREKCCVINITDDPVPFVYGTIRDPDFPYKRSKNFNAPILDLAKAYVELSLHAFELVDHENRMGKIRKGVFRFNIGEIVIREPVVAINRAKTALIEAAICLSRSQDENYRKRFDYFIEVAKRTNKEYTDVIKELEKSMGRFR